MHELIQKPFIYLFIYFILDSKNNVYAKVDGRWPETSWLSG